MLQTNDESHRTSITCEIIDLNLACDLAKMETLVTEIKNLRKN